MLNVYIPWRQDGKTTPWQLPWGHLSSSSNLSLCMLHMPAIRNQPQHLYIRSNGLSIYLLEIINTGNILSPLILSMNVYWFSSNIDSKRGWVHLKERVECYWGEWWRPIGLKVYLRHATQVHWWWILMQAHCGITWSRSRRRHQSLQML